MSPQLTLQTPLELVPSEVPTYLEQLWSPEQQGSTGTGASTFCLLIWQPAWAEQHLVRSGRLRGPITGQQTSDLVAAGRQAIAEADLPISTPPLDGAGSRPSPDSRVIPRQKTYGGSTSIPRSAH